MNNSAGKLWTSDRADHTPDTLVRQDDTAVKDTRDAGVQLCYSHADRHSRWQKEVCMARVQSRTAILAAAMCLCVSCVLVVLGCNSAQQAPSAPPDTRAADEAAVRKADTDWSTAAQSKQVDGWVAFYTDDTVMLPPNDKLTSGKDDIRKAVTGLLTMPGLSLHWQPTRVEVARSGDLAYSYGAYELTYNHAKGKPINDRGKYTEVWKKQSDGAWKCVLDMWSSDLPAAPLPAPKS